MKISFVIITARNDYPYIGKPDLFIFEPTVESLKNQTMKGYEFEVIIVDYLYNQRKDYFKNKDLPFKVKHIPSAPNIWHEKGLAGICTQFNKGIIYADGELLFFIGEGFIFTSEFCERLWKHYKEGYVPLVWYFHDHTFSPEVVSATSEEMGKYPVQCKLPYNISYNMFGYTGKFITMDHRPLYAFKDDISFFNAPWEWWFGCSSAPLEAMLKINGFDQKFDGDKSLFDCDVGSRLELAGYGKFGIFKDLFIVRLLNDNTWNSNFLKKIESIKCNYPLIHWSRNFKHYVANDHENIDEDIKWCKEVYCAEQCNMRELCMKQHPWQYPFEHKEGYYYDASTNSWINDVEKSIQYPLSTHKSTKEGFEYWRTHVEKIDLAEERQKRIAGDEKYKRGTFTAPDHPHIPAVSPKEFLSIFDKFGEE